MISGLLFKIERFYSKSLDAAPKCAIDSGLLNNRLMLALDNEGYLKGLISAASKGKQSVSSKAGGLQFFIIEGGGEGFLPSFYRDKDASRIVETSVSTGGVASSTIFDDNDLLCVFGKTGNLIASALLRRPLSIPGAPGGGWTEQTANKVYHAWDGQPVSLYWNANYLVKYYGLRVIDSLGYYASGAARIDMHKEEQTNGCIFIRERGTPPTYTPSLLSQFEPKFITAVQAAIGAKIGTNIGTMHMSSVR
jgi:hypothetical protein